jgi:hypothetical protein
MNGEGSSTTNLSANSSTIHHSASLARQRTSFVTKANSTDSQTRVQDVDFFDTANHISLCIHTENFRSLIQSLRLQKDHQNAFCYI